MMHAMYTSAENRYGSGSHIFSKYHISLRAFFVYSAHSAAADRQELWSIVQPSLLSHQQVVPEQHLVSCMHGDAQQDLTAQSWWCLRIQGLYLYSASWQCSQMGQLGQLPLKMQGMQLEVIRQTSATVHASLAQTQMLVLRAHCLPLSAPH